MGTADYLLPPLTLQHGRWMQYIASKFHTTWRRLRAYKMSTKPVKQFWRWNMWMAASICALWFTLCATRNARVRILVTKRRFQHPFLAPSPKSLLSRCLATKGGIHRHTCPTIILQLRVFVAAGSCLPRHTDTLTDGKDLWSDIHTKFNKDWSRYSIRGGIIDTQRAWWSHKPALIFFRNKENWQKASHFLGLMSLNIKSVYEN
jgi:hypothetical protein